MTTYYHLSNQSLPVGQQLESFFLKGESYTLLRNAVVDALDAGPDVLKGLILADDLIAARLNSRRLLRTVIIEVIYEGVRRTEFKARPSRWESKFLFEDTSAAERFREEFKDGKGTILVCSVEPGMTFRADMNLLLGPVLKNPDAGRRQMEDEARRYWRGEMSDDPWVELLAHGRVTVTGQL